MSDLLHVPLPCGPGTFLDVRIPRANFVGTYASQDAARAAAPEEMLSRALGTPTAAPPLAELAAQARRVLLIVDDNTRRTPVREMMPIVAAILRDAGRQDDEIEILFASGTHREMSKGEMAEKIGEEFLRRYACTSHDCFAPAHLYGYTTYGTPVEANPTLLRADLKIAIGSIVPHAFCGWAGGGKMILPGVCSAQSILATHLLPCLDPTIALGVVENRARTEIDEAARIAGLDFIINAVLNAHGDIAGLVAGAPVAAHREGIVLARAVHGVEMPEADLVFGCAYPEDLNYWQAGKTLYPLERAVRPGGLAVVVARLPEGKGEHGGLFDHMGETPERLWAQLDRAKETDFDEAMALAASLSDRKIWSKAQVGLISDGLPQCETAGGAFLRFATPDDAVSHILRRNPNARISCLLNAPEMLPIVRDTPN